MYVLDKKISKEVKKGNNEQQRQKSVGEKSGKRSSDSGNNRS